MFQENGFHEKMQDFLRDLGASFVGCSHVRDKLPDELKKVPYAITIGIRLSKTIIDEITDKPTFTYFHHYRAVNTLIDQITLRCMLKLEEEGFRAIAVPASQTVNDKEDKYSGIFPHKTAAIQAGLGWIGKSGLFIHQDYGPRVRLGTILTDRELPVTGNRPEFGCGECRLCVENCPAMALTGNCWEEGCDRGRVVDARACSEFMNARFKHIGRGSVCGICMKVCPKGGKPLENRAE